MRAPEPSLILALHYERELKRYVVAPIWEAVDEVLMPVLERELAGQRQDDLQPIMRASFAALRAKIRALVAERALQSASESVARMVGRAHKQAFYRRLAEAVGIKIEVSEPFFGPTLQAWTSSNVDLIVSVRDAVFLEPDIEAAFKSGVRHEVLRDKWRREGLPLNFGTLEGRSKVIARDQVSKLNGQLTEQRLRNLGIDQYTWRSSGDERVRPEHRARNGKVFSWNAPPKDGHPGEPVLCFPGDTRVWSPTPIRQAMSTRFSGRLVRVAFEGGTILVTPNHPILTLRGFVPAQQIDKRDHVVDVAVRDGVSPRDVHDYEARIDETWRAGQRFSGGCTAVRRRLYGDDAVDDNVHVVNVDGRLGLNIPAPSRERIEQLLFTAAAAPRLGACEAAEALNRAFRPAGRVVRRSSKPPSLGWRGVLHALEHGCAAVSDGLARLLQPTGQDIAAVPMRLGQGLDGLALAVGLNDHAEVTREGQTVVRRVPSAMPDGLADLHHPALHRGLGHSPTVADRQKRLATAIGFRKVLDVSWDRDAECHVYTLSTDAGWFVAEGILVGNCRCVAEAIIDIEALSRAAELPSFLEVAE